MKNNPLFILCLVAAGSLAACGGGGGGSIGIEDLPGELEKAQCEQAVRCGASPDMDTCLASAFAEREDELKSLTNAVNAGTVEYHGDLARECLNLFADFDCTYSGSQDVLDQIEETCNAVFEGNMVEGGACVLNDECVGDGDCVTDPTCTMSCCVGVCGPPETPPIRVPIGDDCSFDQCVVGAYCHDDFVAGTSICAAEVPAGGACEDFDACAAPNLCDIDFTTGMGICGPLPDTGDPCVVDGGLPCDHQDEFCSTQGVCTQRGGAGAACTSNYECLDYTECDGTSCIAQPVEGEACNASTGPNCLGDLECGATGTCAAPADQPGCTIGS